MKINKRYHQILIVCIVAIALAAIMEIVYIHMHKLSEPVFIESYMEVVLPEIKMYEREEETEVELHKDGLYYSVEDATGVGIKPGSDKLEERLNGDCEFELKYITNINDSIQIEGIAFKEAPQLNAYVSQTQDGPFYREGSVEWKENESTIPCGRYAIRTIYVTIPSYWRENLKDLVIKNKSLELNHATISTCINGKEAKLINVNLGRIILTPAKMAENILESIEGNGGSENERMTFLEKYEVKKPVRIVSVDSPLLQDTQKNVGIKIGNVNYTKAAGLQLAKGDILTVESWMSQPKGRGRGCLTYELLPIVTLQDQDGKLYEHQLIEMNPSDIYADYSCKEVRQYLKERGAI